MSNPANWSGPNAPPNTGGTADLIFSGITRTTPNADVNYTINTLRFTSGFAFTIGGNPITLQTDAAVAPFIRNEASVLNRINNNLTFNNDGTIFAQNGNLTFGGVFGTGTNSATPNTITLNAGSGHTINFLGNIGGFGAFTKTGAGTLRITGSALNPGAFQSNAGLTELSGSTSWSAFTLNNSTVRLLANNRIPTVPISLSGTATLDLNGFSDIVGPISGGGGILLGSGGHLTANQNTDTTFTGSITGTDGASLTKSGTGTLTLITSSFYTGPTNINAGTLSSGNNNSFSLASIHSIASGATLAINSFSEGIGGLSGAGTLNLGTGTLIVSQGADTTFSGTITGSGALQKAGTGTLELTSGNTGFTGPTTISGGRLLIKWPTALGSAGAGTTVQSGGTLQIGSGMTINTNESFTFSGTGTGNIGALRVDAATESIATYIHGDINLNANTSITLDRTASYSTLMDLGSASTPGTLALGTRTLTFNGNSTSRTDINHAITGSGRIVLAAPRNLVLRGTNPTYSGPIEIQQGTLTLSNDQALGTGTSAISIATGATLRMAVGTATGANISTSRQLSLSGLMLSPSSASWSGSGNIQTSPGADFRTSGAGTTLTLGGTGQITGTAQVIFSPASDSSILNQRNISLTGSTGISKSGGGTLQLDGTATYTGSTEVTGGTLRLGSTTALPSTSTVNLGTGTTLDLDGFSNQIGGISGSGNVTLGTATLTLNPTTNLIHSGDIAGTGGIEVVGNGTNTQTFNSPNNFTGPTTVKNDGKLILTGTLVNHLSSTATLTIENSGTIVLDTPETIVGGLNGGGTIEFQSPANVFRTLTISTGSGVSSFGGSTSGRGNINKQGSNSTLFLNGATLLHLGETRLKTGITIISQSTSIPNSPIVIESNATLSGHGTIKSFDIEGGSINPGVNTLADGIIMTTALSHLRSGARYRWKITDWNGNSGNGYDVIDAHALHITSNTSSPVVISIDAPASISNFSESPRIFKIVRTTTPITAIDPTAITVEYSNNAAGLTGTWSARIVGNDLELVYTPTGGDTYESWIAGFSVGGLTAMQDDPDGDGIPNGIEYVIGGNPQNVNDSDKLPTITDDGDHFIFSFRRATRSIYLNPRVKHSTTLQNPWNDANHGFGGVTITTNPLETGFDEVSVRIPKNSAAKKFARLYVGPDVD